MQSHTTSYQHYVDTVAGPLHYNSSIAWFMLVMLLQFLCSYNVKICMKILYIYSSMLSMSITKKYLPCIPNPGPPAGGGGLQPEKGPLNNC